MSAQNEQNYSIRKEHLKMRKRNFKRFLAAMLSVVCVMAAPCAAFAQDGVDTIDTSRKVSLTIHKYDRTAAVEDGVDVESMWETYTDGKAHKTGVEDVMKDYAIKDVEFSYAKVGDINTVSESGKVAVMYDIKDADLRKKLGLTAPSTWPDGKTPRTDNKYTSDEISEALKALLSANTKGKNELEAYMKKTGSLHAMEKTDENGVTEVTNLDQGLYLVVETKVPANVKCTTDPFFVSLPMTDVEGESWFYDVTIYPKNQTDIPTLDKKVRQHDDAVIDTSRHDRDLKYYDIGTGSEGDVMDYILVSHLPEITSGATHLTKFDFTDQVDYGIGYNRGSFKIQFYDNESAAYANDTSKAVEVVDKDGKNPTKEWVENDPYFTVSYTSPGNGKNGVKVALTEAGLAAVNRNTDGNDQSQCSRLFLVVSYDATITSDAKPILGDHGNINDVTLEWRRTWTDNYDLLHDEARVYTFGINLTKTFDGPSGMADGKGFDFGDVKFVLQNATDKHYVTATGTPGNYYVTDATKSETESEGTIFIPNADGSLIINGLEADTYILTELETSNGYSLLKEPITIVIDCTEDTITPSVTHLYDVKDDADDERYPDHITVVEGKRASATVDGNATNMSADGGNVSSANARVDMTVVNTSDFLLPQTGGFGTLIFTLLGCGAALAGVIVFLHRPARKKS